MKDNSSKSSLCESAAIRVQYWFGKDKDNLLRTQPVLPAAQEFSKLHTCNLVKPPKIPSQVDHLSLQGYDLAQKKRQTKQRQVTQENPSKPLRISIDQAHCSVNQKNMRFMHPENALSSERVAPCRHREHFLVSKRLKSISKQYTSGPKRHEIVAIKSSSINDLLENPYLQDWGKFKEERHFHIGRVIKYLAD